MRASLLALPLATVALMSILSSDAAAQRWRGPATSPSEEAMAEAQALYEQGSEAADAQRWSDAIDLFERSYSLSGASVALFSLGYTFRAVGRYRDARVAFDQLLDDETVDSELADQASELRVEVAQKVAVLQLAGLEQYDGSTLELDGSPAEDDGARPLQLEMDPGRHALRVEADGFSPYSWEGRLGPGESLSLDVVLEDTSGSILESPWLWAGVGVGVVVIVVVTAIALQSSAQLSPRTEFHLSSL